MIEVSENYALASVDSVDILMKWKGGHGAYPNTMLEPVVVSEEGFTAETKRNIVPDDALLPLTVLSYRLEIRRQLQGSIVRIARGDAIEAGVPQDRQPEVRITKDLLPPLITNRSLCSASARL